MSNHDDAANANPPGDAYRTLDDRALDALLADLRFLAQENGRLRAERDLIRAERDRLQGWLDTDRELTNRMLTALEAEIRALRGDAKPDHVDQASSTTPDSGPSLRTGIGRRIRDRSHEPR
jgi:hypothetical protein